MDIPDAAVFQLRCFKSEGVSILDDWGTLGMRATGSQTIAFDKVFVADASIVLARPRNGYHPVWDVVLTVAMPLIMSCYVGIAEKSMRVFRQWQKPCKLLEDKAFIEEISWSVCSGIYRPLNFIRILSGSNMLLQESDY